MKMEKKQRELDDLLNRHLDGNLSEEDARALSTQIEESPEVRKRYWELASIHGMVEQSIQSASLQATTGRESAEPERRTRVSGLSRIKTGIAGLAIGVFSASVVWAFKLPQDNQPQPKIQEIVSEGLVRYPRFQQTKRYLPQVVCELHSFWITRRPSSLTPAI
jgi:anti-sigma factor RsiW